MLALSTCQGTTMTTTASGHVSSRCPLIKQCASLLVPSRGRCKLKGHQGLPLPQPQGRASRLSCSAGLVSSPPRPVAAPVPVLRTVTKTLSSDDFDIDSLISYEIIQGPLVRWSHHEHKAPPTAVLVHGILGNRKNMQNFAKMIVEGFPSWQILLVDLRCHGQSASLPTRPLGPHTVSTAAMDMLTILRQLKLFPHMLLGHSFGGKVVMSMVQQFGQRLPRPVQVWVLDSLPGDVRSGEADGTDHPSRLIEILQGIPMPIKNRHAVIDALVSRGFSQHIARWMTTNLRPTVMGASRMAAEELEWSFDLDGIADLYRSYEMSQLWPLLEAPPQGLKLDFVKAEKSDFRWGGSDEQGILQLGHRVHLLRNAGHWVHTDNPVGLFDIIAPTFGQVDLHQRRTSRL